MDQKPGFEVGTSRCGVAFAIIGAVVGLILIFIGFWKALLVAALAAIGYLIGAKADKAQFIRNKVNQWFPPKN